LLTPSQTPRGADDEHVTPDGYRLLLTCGCGVEFKRWVPKDADDDLLRSALLAFETDRVGGGTFKAGGWAMRNDRLKCDGSPKCRNAPTHVHRGSRALVQLDKYYCNKCCPLTTCPDAQKHRL
jgi:hypothetical protein